MQRHNGRSDLATVKPVQHAACPGLAGGQRYEPSWRRESVSAGDGSGAATRRLRRLWTTGTETASNAAPCGPATQIGAAAEADVREQPTSSPVHPYLLAPLSARGS
jgi:hypothetical protein